MIISGIDICSVPHLNRMVEKRILNYFLPDCKHCLLLRLQIWLFDFNDSFTALTIIVRNNIYSSIKVPKNMESFKATQTIILNCLIILSLHVFILNYVVRNIHVHVYTIRMYANAIQVSKCLMYTVSVHNIVWQY